MRLRNLFVLRTALENLQAAVARPPSGTNQQWLGYLDRELSMIALRLEAEVDRSPRPPPGFDAEEEWDRLLND